MSADVITIRGAPGVGKSVTAKALAARLGRCVRLEVDTLRAMVVPARWTDQQEHVSMLSLAASVVAEFLERGHRPVIVVDTFSGDKLRVFLAELREKSRDVELRAFALVVDPEVLRARIEARPEDRFKDLAICEKQNAEVRSFLQAGEQLIDTTSLTPEQVVDAVLGVTS